VSNTYFYLAGPGFTEAVNQHVHALASDKALFDDHMSRLWSAPVPYTHAAFLADFQRKRAAGREIYYLAHTLVHERIGAAGACESTKLNVELLQFLEGGFEDFGDDDDDEVRIPKAVVRFAQAGGFVTGGTEIQARRSLTKRGLGGLALEQALLLNKLGNRRSLKLRPAPRETQFPVWIIAGWENYEGHLSYADVRRLDPKSTTSFFSLYHRALLAGAPDNGNAVEAIAGLIAMRDRVLALGRGTTCIAVSSV
jgi:hypothetical protein